MHRIDEGLFARRPEPMRLGTPPHSDHRGGQLMMTWYLSLAFTAAAVATAIARGGAFSMSRSHARGQARVVCAQATGALPTARRSSKVFACDHRVRIGSRRYGRPGGWSYVGSALR